jgi:hypothetical protein
MKRTKIIDPEHERAMQRPAPSLGQQIAGLGLFSGQTAPEPVQHVVRVRSHTRTVSGPAPDRGEAGKEEALALLKAKRADLYAKLCAEAIRVWRETLKPVSANEIRHILIQEGYEGDGRILGTVFGREWQKVGITRTDSKLANARDIGTFVFKHPLTRS